MRTVLLVVAASLVVVLAEAGSEKVAYPKDYRSKYVLFATKDNPPFKTVRFMYVNPEALKAAKPGQPLPDGTVLVAEDRNAKLNAKGEPVKGADGRFVVTEKIFSVLVQEKRKGWGTEYPADTRNGEWEYAFFQADGSRKADAKIADCMACHKGQAAEDYTFRFFKYVADKKK